VKLVGFETFLANAGLRNYLFIQLRTDNGLTGIGEATLEWQEKTVETLLHEWVVRSESFDRMIAFVPVHLWVCGR
jgi:galactonate dehydratase